MSLFLSKAVIWRAGLLALAVFAVACVAGAQSSSAQDQSAPSGYSSSQAQLAQLTDPALPYASALESAASSAGQYGQGGGGGAHRGLFHNFTFEAGGGFNAPVGNDIPFITWGGNFTLGAGFRFSKAISALLEYQLMDDKLPGPMLSAYGVQAGNSHINSITGSPVIDLTPKWSNGIYLVGGWGYYHKSTNLQDYEEEESYYGVYDVPVTVASITSNQWGGNAGLGIYHRFGGMYGDGKSQLFAEARYTFIHTPPPASSTNSLGTNGFGTTELIPVALGIRF